MIIGQADSGPYKDDSIKKLQDELIEERKKIVLDILSRGKTAVFTRPHYLLDNCNVVKKVTEWKVDIDEKSGMYDLHASETKNASTPYIALWDNSYIITEE